MINHNNIPQHIAIIMDGNGRWAKERGLPRAAGHREGIKRVREIVKAAGELGIKFLTFFTFSTENWCRPQREVSMLMRALDNYLKNQLSELDENNIRLLVIGECDPLPKYLQKRIACVQEHTKGNSGIKVILALNYGARQEIVNAAKRFAGEVACGKESVESLDEGLFSSLLYTGVKKIPDPELLIRTSGEMRISNFLLWQISYAELYFSDKYWPDFGRGELEAVIREYQKRERRFGDIDAREKNR